MSVTGSAQSQARFAYCNNRGISRHYFSIYYVNYQSMKKIKNEILFLLFYKKYDIVYTIAY